jgi:solute:Na+ symporter, SSS family
LDNPVLAFPLFAEQVLPSGIKGIFYAALFATIISTQVSFLFLSGTTIGRDFLFRIRKNASDSRIKSYTISGLIISGVIAILLAYFIPSVIEIWYTIGSLFIPGIILPVVSAYYPKVRVDKKFILVEMIVAFLTSTVWYFARNEFVNASFLNEIEPMLVGIVTAIIIHFVGIFERKSEWFA